MTDQMIHTWDEKEQECSCGGQLLGESHWHHQTVQAISERDLAREEYERRYDAHQASRRVAEKALSERDTAVALADALAGSGQAVVDTTYLYGEGKKSIRDVEAALAAWTIAHASYQIFKKDTP